MKKNSILFKPYMARALLDKVKTQTRRLESMTNTYSVGDVCIVREQWYAEKDFDNIKPSLMKARLDEEKRSRTFWFEAGGTVMIGSDGTREYDNGWTPRINRTGKMRESIFIPDFISRQTIIMETVRVEPLLNITDDDARAEGIRAIANDDPKRGYAHWGVLGVPEIQAETATGAYFQLWDLISGPGHHKTNPNVRVFGFSHWPVNYVEVM
jgi:hypothetical protein